MAAQPLQEMNLTSLAKSISSGVKVITDILHEEKLPQPTLSPAGPMKYPNNPRLQEARMSLLSAAWALEQLVAGPQDYIYWQAFTVKYDLTVLHAFAKFGIFDAVPASGDISFSDLAAKLPLTERQLRRLFKHAMTKNIFCEPRPNHVAHTALSIAPLKNRSLIPWINHGLGVVLPASSRLADAIEKFGDSEDITQVAVSMAWNLEPGKGIFDFFKGDGEGPNEGWRARQFAEAMAAMDGGGHDRRYTVEGFDWGSLGEATVVDVGGSSGHVSFAVADKFPALQFVVQDLPEAEAAYDALASVKSQPRVSFQTHDFMTPQPQHNVDVFLLRHVLHDWPNGIAVKILQNLINGKHGLMKDGARIIVVDNIMPPTGALPTPLERLITTADLEMWTALNASERTKEDWTELFKKADERLEPVAFVQPEGSTTTVIEVVFRHK